MRKFRKICGYICIEYPLLKNEKRDIDSSQLHMMGQEEKVKYLREFGPKIDYFGIF
jgi:hypothetical protein